MKAGAACFASLFFAAALLAGCGKAEAQPKLEGKMADGPFVCNGMDAREVLATIVGNGADLKNMREGVFYFYGPEPVLTAFEVDLQALGFSVRSTRTEPGRIATINAVLDDAWLSMSIPKLCDLAHRHGVTYDGWEASIPESAKR